MLINIRISELQSNTKNIIPLAITITIALNYPLFKLLPYDMAILSNNYYMNNILYQSSLNKYYSNFFDLNVKDYNLSFVTSNMWDGNLAESGHIISLGSIMYTNYPMWLLIASFILLLAMVGCILITLKTDNNVKIESGALQNRSAPTLKHQIQLLSSGFKNTSKRLYSTLANVKSVEINGVECKLDPWFVTGLIDGESYFSVSTTKSSKYKLGWRVGASFSMGLNIKDRALLVQLKNFFWCWRGL